MWSSSPDRPLVFVTGAILAAAAYAVAPPAGGAETFAQPFLEAGITHHTNRGLRFEDEEEDSVTGYGLDGSMILGVNTPASRTLLRPGVSFEGFRDRSDLNFGDYSLDFRNEYNSPRHQWELVAKGQYRDTLSTEYFEPGFDDFDPNDPTVTDPGQIEADNSITRVQLRPAYDYLVTQRVRVGLDAVGQAVRFGTQRRGNRVDYDYLSGGATWAYQTTERMAISFNPHVTSYETVDGDYRSEGVGAAIGLAYEWSERSELQLAVNGERDSIERIPIVNTPSGPVPQPLVEEETTNWGAQVSLLHRGEISELRLSIGRLLSPSTRGSKVTADHVNLQWERQLSERMDFVAAGRYVRENSIGSEQVDQLRDRTYGAAEITLRWRITPRWYLHGGVEGVMQELEFIADRATDVSAFVGLGYAGLGPQTGSTD